MLSRFRCALFSRKKNHQHPLSRKLSLELLEDRTLLDGAGHVESSILVRRLL